MIWTYVLVAGLALWYGAHFFKRVMPGRRAAMTEKMGEAARGPIAFLILISVAMMVVGFRGSDFVAMYEPPSWGRHANNLMMIFAVLLLGLGSSKSRARGWLRHPMLTGVLLWSGAHLLVNGDRDSVLLFGGMAIWSLVEMLVINSADPKPEPFKGGSLAGDIRLVVISAVVFVVIAAIHIWVGPNPFTG